MPTYEYRCLKCSETFVLHLSVKEHDAGQSDHEKIKCPKCQSEKIEQMVSSVFVKTSRKS